MKCLRIRLLGTVQGVSFRAAVIEEANRREVKGYVHNASDGSVVIEAEGELEALKAFLTRCQAGLDVAQVENIAVEDKSPQGYERFEIRY
jgi:acylphosphatase